MTNIGEITAWGVIILAIVAGFGCFWMEDRHSDEVMSLAGQDLPTPVHNLAFRFNQTDYALVYTPAGDESTVTITPMLWVSGFASGSWKTMRGMTVAAPTTPIRFSGKHGDGYGRFEIGIEHGSEYRVEYFDKPVTARDVARGATN